MNDDERNARALADADQLLTAIRSLDVSQQLTYARGTTKHLSELYTHIAQEHPDEAGDFLGVLALSGLTLTLATESIERAMSHARMPYSEPPLWFLNMLNKAVEHAQS